MYLIDTHAHFDDFEEKGIIDKVYQNAIDNNVKKMIAMSLDVKTSKDTLALSKKYLGIIPAVGIYPSEVLDNSVFDIEKLIKDNPNQVKAIGEIGIDLYHKHYPSLDKQKEIFIAQLELSIKYNLPVSIHARESLYEIIAILKTFKGKVKGVIHSFVDPKYISEILDLGLLVGINGIITYKGASDLRDCVKTIPLDKIVLETDSPYLAPRPYKPYENEPSLLINVAKTIAEIKNLPLETVIKETTKNAEELFKI